MYFLFIIGPLTYTKEGKTTIHGVVSASGGFGPFAACVSPIIYMRVSYPVHLQWIKNVLENFQ